MRKNPPHPTPVLALALVGATLATAGIPGVTDHMTANALAAGPPPQPNAAQIQAALAKLAVAGSVLYVAAHPDDENTALLAYLANGARVRAGYLSLTRGDGGQNLVGPEQGPELGLIRTQELLAARRIDGAEQLFTRARDFGYSKTPDETLRIWGKDAVLADVVWVIRRFRPDVIITRFSPEPSDTHGHHTASAMLAVEAFRAAADPRFHPEQLAAGVTPWQARRLLWNRSSWNARPGEDLTGFAKLDVGGFDPLLGASYGEIAADSRSMHKSQGFGVARSRGPVPEYFKTLAEAGAPPAALRDPLQGLDFSLGRWGNTAPLRAAIERAQKQFDPAHPAASIPALAAVETALDSLPDEAWRARKQREVRDLMLACAGLFADATAADFRVAPGDTIEVTATALNRSPAAIALREIRFPGDAGVAAVGKPLAAPAGVVAAPVEVKRTLRVPADLPLSTPYWLSSPPQPGGFVIDDQQLVGTPEDEPRLHVDFVFDVALGAVTRPLVVSRPVAFKWTDPVAGERYRPLEITPRVSVRPDTQVLMFPEKQHEPRALTVRLTAGAPSVKGVLHLAAPTGWQVEPASAPFAMEHKGQELELGFNVRLRRAPAPSPPPAAAAAAAAPALLRVFAELESAPPGEETPARFARGVVHIEHAHVPIQTWLAAADVRLVPLALETAGTRIGYIPGPGDEVPASLRRVGYDVTLLDGEAVRAGGAALAHFDAVVVGVRAFNTSERLRAAHEALMKYVEGGGTLVVQYNTNSRIAPLTAPVGPFPFEIGRDRVTDETAVVTITPAGHPSLTTPNKIGAGDFDGWIQERGLYFAETWDGRYETPLAMHDPGEKPLAGALLWARHGKGTFVYTGLAFFRQLPAGVPGAFRLFANLMAHGRTTHAH